MCNVHIWYYLDVVYRFNYDTMSLLHTYIVTRIHILNIEKKIVWHITHNIHTHYYIHTNNYYSDRYIDTNTHTYTHHTILLSQCLIYECTVFTVALSLDKWSDVILSWSTSVHETSLVFFLFSLSKRQHPVLHKWNISKNT